MNQRIDPKAIIYQVVRGQRPIADLAHLGIRLQFIDGDFQIECPHMEGVALDISDIAYGLLKYRSSPGDLKKWARLILAGSAFIDFSKCESQTGYEVLLNALWDSLGAGQFSEEAKHLAEELATN